MADSLEYRKRFFRGNFIFLGVLILILVVVFLLRDLLSGAKLDLTADKIYTVSPATKEILSKLIDDITVNYYCSAELPGQYQTLKRETKNLFDEFHDLSKGGHFQYAILNPDDKASEYAEEQVREYFREKDAGRTPKEPEPPQTIEQIFGGRKPPGSEDIRKRRDEEAANRAAKQGRKKDEVYRELLVDDWKRNYFQKLEQEGISPRAVMEREASSVRQVKVFSSIEIKYLAREPEIIPFHQMIESLEYELASRILKLTTDDKPVVAVFDGRKPPAPPFNPMSPQQPPDSDYSGILRALGELFDIQQIDLKESNSIDTLIARLKEDKWRKVNDEKDEAEKEKELTDKEVKPEDLKLLKCLVILQPDQLESRQIYEINRAVSLGVPTIFLVSPYSMDISRQGVQSGLPLEMISPGLDELFRKWGVELGSEILASNQSGTVELPTPVGGQMVMLMAQPLPVSVASAGESILQSSPLTNRIPYLVFPTTTGLKLLPDVLKRNGLEHEVLARTTEESWSVRVDPFQRAQNPLRKHQGIGVSVVDYREELAAMKDPKEFQGFIDPVPLAVLVRGKLPFTFEGETIPEWRKEEPKDPRGAPDPHAGIPGFPGDFPGISEDGDHDLRLNLVDPQDAKEGGAAAPAALPPAESRTEAPPAGAPVPASTPAPGDPAASSDTAAPGDPAAVPATPQAATDSTPADKAAEQPAVKPKATVNLVDGRILVLASVDMLKNDFLMQQSRDYQPNISFFHNAIETFGLGDLLLQIRRKQLTVRNFKPGSDKWMDWITWINIAVVPGLVGVVGLGFYLVRRAESAAYERKFIARQ
ncbi:MAG TPA: GldG family protein [Planctomycetota bacterium]|nr:GldG family protein [Planctomycetota bacterium]